jgi:hypothetical protein
VLAGVLGRAAAGLALLQAGQVLLDGAPVEPEGWEHF